MSNVGPGVEAPTLDIMDWLTQSLKTDIMIIESLVDMLVYGLRMYMATLCLTSFSLVLLAFRERNMDFTSNDIYST